MQIDRPIAIALTLFIILLLMFFFVVPEYSTFQKLQTSVAEKTAQYRAQYDYYAAIDKTYFDLQSHKSDIEKIDDALPQDPALGQLVYFLQEEAVSNGLVVKDLFLSKSSSANPGTSTKVKEITFSMDISGDYASLEGFISSMEESSRIFEVTNISFGSAGSGPNSFSLQIKTYSY